MKKILIILPLLLLLALPAFAATETPHLVAALDGDTSFEAGKTVSVVFTVENMSGTTDLKNLLFSLSAASPSLSPAGASGVYMESIKKGGKASLQFEVDIAPDTTPGRYPLTLHAQFDTKTYSMMSADMTVYISVTQELRFAWGDVMLTSSIIEGGTTSCQIELMNLGKSTVCNVRLKTDVPGLSSSGTVLVGNLAPGESKTGRASYIAYAPDGAYGTQRGTVTVQYENEEGMLFEEALPVQIEIREKPAVVQEQAVQKPIEKLLPDWVLPSLTGIGGIVLGCAVAALAARAAQRRRDERTL